MPLCIDLKPHERLIINGASIRNGDRRAKLWVETQSRFLRDSEILMEQDADTPSKRLWFQLQVIYLSEDRAGLEADFRAQAEAVMEAAPSTTPYILAIYEELVAGRHHHAIKRAKELVRHEATLLEGLRDAA